MRKPVTFVIALNLVIFCVPSNAASSIKSGAKCLKVNQTAIVGFKKFTCVKLKSKLTWDAGVVLLKQPIFTAKTLGSNFEWQVTVDNYVSNADPNLIFIYFFAVDGGMWIESTKSTAPRVTILVNQEFKLLEMMVAVSDRKNQYVISSKFERTFQEVVVPPQSEAKKETPNNSSTPLPTPEAPPVLRVDDPTLPTGLSVG